MPTQDRTFDIADETGIVDFRVCARLFYHILRKISESQLLFLPILLLLFPLLVQGHRVQAICKTVGWTVWLILVGFMQASKVPLISPTCLKNKDYNDNSWKWEKYDQFHFKKWPVTHLHVQTTLCTLHTSIFGCPRVELHPTTTFPMRHVGKRIGVVHALRK